MIIDLNLKHAKNFRDLGGKITKDGRKVKCKLLLRGKTLNKMRKSDLNILKNEYQLKTVIDLRTNKERLEKPNGNNNIIEGLEILHKPIFDEAKAGISHEKKTHSFASLKLMPPMETVYATMVKMESLENLCEILKMILTFPQEKYSVLYHCSAGKDRTGIVSALLLLFLGVDREQVFEDYLYTNRYNAKKAEILSRLLFLVKWDKNLSRKIKFYLLAEKSFLDSSLKILEEDYGSIEEFFNKKLNFTPEEVEKIKNKFLEQKID